MEQGCIKRGGWDKSSVSLYRFGRMSYKLRKKEVQTKMLPPPALLLHLPVIAKSYKSSRLGWECCTALKILRISRKDNGLVGVGFKPCLILYRAGRWGEERVRIDSCADRPVVMSTARQTDVCCRQGNAYSLLLWQTVMQPDKRTYRWVQTM
jgi:hypothetical protein